MSFRAAAAALWGFGDYDTPDLVLGGVDEQGVEWILAPVEGWNRTSVATPVTEGGDDGGRFTPGRRRPKVLTVTGAFRAAVASADLWAAELRLRAAVERVDADTLLWCGGVRPQQMAVRLTGDLDVDMPRRNPRVRVFTAVLTAVDPFKYAAGAAGAISLSAGLPLPPRTFGLTWPVSAPFDFGGVTSLNYRIAASNPGAVPTFPQVTFTGPVINPALAHLGLGVSIGMNRTLAAGETVTFDHRYSSVRSSGRSVYTQRMAGSVFFPLNPGGNTLVFSADVFDPAAVVSVSYRPRWS